jgi:hypothetical protein
MKNDKLIISMTSHPPRIDFVKPVMESILNQTVSRDKYHIVLVLAIPEFPNKEKDLPTNLRSFVHNNGIEIIWHPRNIKSHKKLIPTLLKYPDSDILVCDDDVERQKTWIETFMKDHEKYPDDIICGQFSYVFDSALKPHRLTGGYKGSNIVPSLIFKYGRPANGLGGVLYPAHTFTDERFFDEDMIMKYSPTSDETWQYCFCIMNNKTLRQTSTIYNDFAKIIPGTQHLKNTLSLTNNYEKINQTMFEAFPEYKEKLLEHHFIISLTTHGERIKTIQPTIESLLNQTLKADKIVITLYKTDIKNITPYLQNLIDDGKIELIKANVNVKPHCKYFYAMQQYRDVAIITVDDDIIYPPTMTTTLWNTYRKHQNCIVACRTHKIVHNKTAIAPYKTWEWECKQHTPSFDLFATGVGGVLYPPDILHITNDNLPEIKKCINADDVYLKYLEAKKHIMTVWAECQTWGKEQKAKEILESALNTTNVHGGGNDEYIKTFPPVDPSNFQFQQNTHITAGIQRIGRRLAQTFTPTFTK